MQLTSVLIVLVGLLVPVLAAAPFYVLDSRAEQRADEAAAQRRADEVGASGSAELGADGTASDEASDEMAHDDRRDAVVASEPVDQEHEDTAHALPFPTQPTAGSIEQEVPTMGNAVQHSSVQHSSEQHRSAMAEAPVERVDQASEGIETSAA